MEQLTIEERAAKKAEKLGWKLLETTKLTHPADHYLIYTTVEINSRYATHLFNGSFNEFAYGHYDFKTAEDAVEDMKGRVK